MALQHLEMMSAQDSCTVTAPENAVFGDCPQAFLPGRLYQISGTSSCSSRLSVSSGSQVLLIAVPLRAMSRRNKDQSEQDIMTGYRDRAGHQAVITHVLWDINRSFQPLKALKAIDKMIEMGAAADPELLKKAADAHHKAIGSISGPNGVTSRADWDAVNAALGRVVASVPKQKVMDVYDAVKDITDPKVPAYMKSLVNGADAEKAYQGFLEFKDVVAANQVTTASAAATVPTGDKIGTAAKALSDASYPFIKDI
eukprot:symbB.v1.2.040335.t1/scaffold7154.1/size13002/1